MLARGSKLTICSCVYAAWLAAFCVAAQTSVVAGEAGAAERQSVAGHIEQLLGIGILPEARVALDRYSLVAFYERRQYRPGWSDAQGVYPDAARWLSLLSSLQGGGHDPAFHVEEIQQHLNGTGPAELAALDLLLSDSFLQFAGRQISAMADAPAPGVDWEIPRPAVDPLDLLEEAVAGRGIRYALRSLEPRHAGYYRLRDKLAGYLLIDELGGWPAFSARGDKLGRGSESDEIPDLRRLLWLSGDLDEQALDARRFDAGLEQAVRRFQARHGLAVDGVVGRRTRAELAVPLRQRIEQIRVNLQRWQWLPRDMGERYITVNTPAYELQVHEDDKVTLSMRVIVGKKQRATPVFMEKMRYLVVNPYWRVPDTIVREDLIPALLRDPAYLQQQNIRVLSDWYPGATEIDPAQVSWQDYLGEKTYIPYQLRQDPGRGNSLGRVKFMLPNRHSVYLHDTPARHLFEEPVRAFSSGCIRIEQPMTLANYVLGIGNGGRKPGIEALVAAGETRTVMLPEPIPVYVLYQTAWVDEQGHLNFRDDVYQRDAQLAASLPPLERSAFGALEVKKSSSGTETVTMLRQPETR